MSNSLPTDRSEALRRAGAEFRARLGLVEGSDWDRPTPCDEWDVRALVNHVVGGNVRYAMIMRGEPSEKVEALRSVDALGNDPISMYENGLQAITTAFELPDLDARQVIHPRLGLMTAGQIHVLRVNELSVHAWDLGARARRR